jgi:hypothetical protein
MDATAGRGASPDLRLIRDVDDALAACVNRHPANCTQRELEIADSLRGFDPDCRYAADPTRYPGHECRRNTGEATRLGEACIYETRAQLIGDCTACGRPIAGSSLGSVTTPDGRHFRFHGGDCFLQADEAIAAHDRGDCLHGGYHQPGACPERNAAGGAQ